MDYQVIHPNLLICIKNKFICQLDIKELLQAIKSANRRKYSINKDLIVQTCWKRIKSLKKEEEVLQEEKNNEALIDMATIMCRYRAQRKVEMYNQIAEDIFPFGRVTKDSVIKVNKYLIKEDSKFLNKTISKEELKQVA